MEAPAPSYSFFDSHRFIWARQRPDRSPEEVDALEQQALKDAGAPAVVFSYEDRVAIRSLFYAVLDDTTLRDWIDGFLVPPPYAMADITAKRWTSADVKVLCNLIHPSLDVVVVQIPLNIAVQLGNYNAKLRAASRRLCWILALPFSIVEAREEALSMANCQLDSSSDLAANAEKQEQVRQAKTGHQRSLKRVITIGGFAVLGGAALVLTGGLAAPLVAPAYGVLLSAAATTIGAIGTVGGAILGTGTIAGIFAGIVGAATHAAALASIVTPALSATSLTAIFGVAGASLGGYKAMRRTADSDIFIIRSINDVESFEQALLVTDRATDEEEEAVLQQLADVNQTVKSGSVGTTWDLSAVVEDDSKAGVVVPTHTRAVAMGHVKSMSFIKKRYRSVVFAVENELDGYELRLKAIKVLSGLWAMAPSSRIPYRHAGLVACMNRFARPTGAGFILCYTAIPVSGTKGAVSYRIWARVERDFCGALELSSACEKEEREFEPISAEWWLEANCSSNDMTRRQEGVVLEMRAQPFPVLKVYTAKIQMQTARQVVFPNIELPQRRLEYLHAVKERRKISVSFVNRSAHTINVRDMRILNGMQWCETPSPIVLNPAEASLTMFTNSSWSMEGAEGYYIIELVNANDAPVTPRYYVRAQFEVSALNNVNVSCASAYNFTELRGIELKTETPSGQQFSVELPPGLFFTLNCVVDVKLKAVEFVVQDSVERGVLQSDGRDRRQATLSIGVCGYSAVFDPRRPTQDQQVGLWQPVLRFNSLIGSTEAYAVQWEDEYLMKLGESIRVDLDIAGTVTKKVVGKAKSAAKKVVMQGAIFTGFHAFSSFLTAFQLPLYAVWATDVIDNCFATVSNRATYAGKDLAAALLEPQHGSRPVTLIGFSFGCEVISECLSELHRVHADALVENVYLLGSTMSSDSEKWRIMRRAVAGRLVNVYTREDWTLWMMYHLNKTSLKPMAGITPVNFAGVENVDVTPLISQHGDYAARLSVVLETIPQAPTLDTWLPSKHSGSPGVTVGLKKSRSTTLAVAKSLHSYINSIPYSAIAIKNCVLTDVENFVPVIENISSNLFQCYFDFVPPPVTRPGQASVSGILAEDEMGLGAVLGYRLCLPPSSERDVLLVLLLYNDADVGLCCTVQSHLVQRRATADEDERQAIERFTTIVTQCASSLAGVYRSCVTAAGESDAILVPNGSPSVSQSFPVAIPLLFTDSHRTATLHTVMDRVDGGVMLSVVGLLKEASTQLQQEQFTEAAFRNQFQSSGGAMAESTFTLPSVAVVQKNENLQSSLVEVATELSAEQTNGIRPVVLVNSGVVSLFFSEDGYEGSPSHPSASPVANEGVILPQWIRFPPPELPAESFCVVFLNVGAASSNADQGISIRYESINSQCAFDIHFGEKSSADDHDRTNTNGELLIPITCRNVESYRMQGQFSVTNAQVKNMDYAMVILDPRVAQLDDPQNPTDSDAKETLRNSGIPDAAAT